MRTFYLAVAGVLLPGWLWAAKPLTESTFTQVINDVKVLAEASRTPTPAKLNGLFKTPDLLRTGADSLAELMAGDQTITRVGANTVFSFEADGRNINLEQGSLLFHSPKGKGGGTIKTRAASAAVLGTTIVIVATANGGFKAIILEGRGQIRLPNGNFRILQAGQLVFVLPGAVQFGPVLNINLDTLVKGSRLINGFQAKLPSVEKIQLEVVRQLRQIAQGKAEDTGMLVGDNATKEEVKVVASSLLERAVGETALQRALRTDATISSPKLDPDRVFLDKFAVQYNGVTFTQRGFVGRDIEITSPSVDLGAYNRLDAFDILASGKLSLPNDVTFLGQVLSVASFDFSLTAAAFNFAHGITLETDMLGDFAIQSGSSLNLFGVNVNNLDGRGVEITTVTDHGDVFGDIQMSVGVIEGSPIELRGGNVSVFNSSLVVNGPSGPAFASVLLRAKNDLSVNSSGIIGFSGGSAAALSAGDTLNVSGLSFSFINFIALEARTLVLQNIDFPSGSSVLLRSTTGLLAANPNTSQTPVPGYVNFISNVTHGGSPAELQVPVTQGGQATGPSAIGIGVFP